MDSAMYAEHDGSKRQLPAKKGDTSSLYTRSRPRATITATDASAAGGSWTVAPGEDVSVVGVKAGKRSIEHFPAGNDHDVDPLCDLISPEHLTRQTLHAVPDHGTAELSRGGDAKPTDRAAIRDDEHRHVLPLKPPAGIVGSLKLGPSTNAVRARQRP
jgi:hypothetical protein